MSKVLIGALSALLLVTGCGYRGALVLEDGSQKIAGQSS